ncbi:MAG: DUF2285 domain-containing protein [Sphingobium sp.]|nr:DUF2285 domain-containing protein [Sphingobium sp.]
MPNLRGDGGYPFAHRDFTGNGPLFWQPDRIPVAILLDTAPPGFRSANLSDISALGTPRADANTPNGRHLVIADPNGEHRLWVYASAHGRSIAAIIPFDADFDTRITSLLRFHRHLLGHPSGSLPRGWALTPYRRDRLLRMIRAFDLKQAGASYRAIAIALDSDEAAVLSATEWKLSSTRSWTIRLVRAARMMVNGGYRKLLTFR